MRTCLWIIIIIVIIIIIIIINLIVFLVVVEKAGSFSLQDRLCSGCEEQMGGDGETVDI